MPSIEIPKPLTGFNDVNEQNEISTKKDTKTVTTTVFTDNSKSTVEKFVWDWPFCEDHLATGFLSHDKFFVCLPFTRDGTGKLKGTLKQFDKISDCNFCWAIGLCSDGLLGSCFWRFEIEILRNLNTLVLNASKDVSRPNELAKRLKNVRKVYRLPKCYDISTLTTVSYNWAIIIEANRRVDTRIRRL